MCVCLYNIMNTERLQKAAYKAVSLRFAMRTGHELGGKGEPFNQKNDINLVLTWELCSCCLAFTVLEVSLYATRGEKYSSIYPGCEPCKLQ